MSYPGVEMSQQTQMGERSPSTKNLSTQATTTTSTSTTTMTAQEKMQQHPLHQYDWTVMGQFLDTCVNKMKEQQPSWKPTEWANVQPMPTHLPWEQKNEWCNPLVMSQKQRVYECFAKLARETGEPMILMPSFDYGDILNFERFLQALKKDGVNAIGKYKQYLNNKDMRKFEIDLVVMHARYGIMLIEVKDCDHLDAKRRSRARAQLNQARGCFETMGRLIIEAKGWTTQEAQIPVTEFIALPNVLVRPVPPSAANTQPQQPLLSSNIILHTNNENQDHSGLSSGSMSSGRQSRQIHYIVKSDLENGPEFAKWWTKHVVETKQQQMKQAELDNKPNKFDVSVLNWMTGLINCIRNNSIMPVVYPESGNMFAASEPTPTPTTMTTTTTTTTTTMPPGDESKPLTTEPEQQRDNTDKHVNNVSFTQALNLHGEFFQSEHEKVRSLQKVIVTSKDVEQIRKTICLQTLWLLLNDSQKKISVVCSELNKPYYEEFFARQRKLYNNLNNVRFFTDLHSCAVNGQSTLKKEGDMWFFDSAINGTLSNVMERVKDLNGFWIFTTQEEMLGQWKNDLDSWNVRICRVDQQQQQHQQQQHQQQQPEQQLAPLTKNLKFPLRLQTDLLIIGDIVDSTQMKTLYHVMEKNQVTNQATQYQNGGHHQSSHHYHHHQQQQQREQQPKYKLHFNAAKKFKSVKFIRGGTIDNLRSSLKMHDSIQAQVVLLHVGDEDLFKTRQSATTAERIKELANLVKEYCPNSFIILSTLMRRMSRTENQVSNEVNKGIVSFCKQTRETANFHYMLNNHFDPEYHTHGGRVLINHGLRQYMENALFVIDYFMIRRNKQH